MLFLLVTPVVPRVEAEAFAACFERARLRCELKYEALAALCGISRPRLMQCLTTGDFGMRKLFVLMHDADGRRFVEALFQEISPAHGLREWDGVVAALMKATHAITDGLQMARASLRSEHRDERKSA